MDSKFKSRVNQILIGLIVLDIVLFSLCLFAPALWFKIFHASPYVDPAGLLKRTGGVWIAFTLLQFLAWRKWEKKPYWLVLIAGVRLTELFSDWIYMGAAHSLTWFGYLGLFIAPPANLAIGWFLIQSYLKVRTINPKNP